MCYVFEKWQVLVEASETLVHDFRETFIFGRAVGQEFSHEQLIAGSYHGLTRSILEVKVSKTSHESVSGI